MRTSIHRYLVSGETAILIVLVRLHDGRRWGELEPIFRRDLTQLSECFAETVALLEEEKGHVLTRVERFKPRMARYAEAIHAKVIEIYPDVDSRAGCPRRDGCTRRV